MSNNETVSAFTSGERLSFLKLFKKKQLHVQIPIIQRDYAQGRDSSEDVKNAFLDALYGYLDAAIPHRDLDFIYGSLYSSDVNRFIPLDGQQRLTTLFLLHWYLATISKRVSDFQSIMSWEGTSKFSYETRTSSKDFCDALIANVVDMDSLLPPDKGSNNSLSKTITDKGWFFLSWRFDPTIRSMLSMLDSIHCKFRDVPHFYDLLTDDVNPVITFLTLNLKEFKLTDDLYIKMNSRGKPLTGFENFKAKLEQYISNLEWEEGKSFKLIFENNDRLVTAKEYFSRKIDKEWADLFWNYRNKLSPDSSFDKEIMNLIRVVFSCQYALDQDADENLDFLIGTATAKKRADYTDDISFYKYQNLNALSRNAAEYLMDALDCLYNGEDGIMALLGTTTYFDENLSFKNVIEDELTLVQRIQFHAYLKFLILHPKDVNGLHQWMRFIRNVTENTGVDGSQEVVRALKSIEKLLPFSQDILAYLISPSPEIEFFYSRQIQEEIIKAHLIKIHGGWIGLIEDLESLKYFSGQILFVLEYAGILDYFESNGDCNWDKADNEKFQESFKYYATCSKAIFQKEDTSWLSDYLWERSVLTKGDYLVATSSERFNFLSTNFNLRDYSWKRLLRVPPATTYVDEAEAWRDKRLYVKAVFDDQLFNPLNAEGSLNKIIKNTTSDWRKYFIENPLLIGYCRKGFIRYEEFENGNALIKLLGSTQQNHKHREMRTYNLYLQSFAKQEGIEPFGLAWHREVRNTWDFSGLIISGWTFNRRSYSLNVYFTGEKQPFEVKFIKDKGNKSEGDYDAAVQQILREHSFSFDGESEGFRRFSKDENNTKKIIDNLCSSLSAL